MALLNVNKVTSLPGTPAASAIYFLKDGSRYKMYITDNSGTLYASNPYTISSGLADNGSGTITNTLVTGLSGGQNVYGGTGAGENLTLRSTTNATKGSIVISDAVRMIFLPHGTIDIGQSGTNQARNLYISSSGFFGGDVTVGNGLKITAASGTGDFLTLSSNGASVTKRTAAQVYTDLGFPSQTGNSGKFITTNGTTLSWATVSGGSAQTIEEVLITGNDANGGSIEGLVDVSSEQITVFDGTHKGMTTGVFTTDREFSLPDNGGKYLTSGDAPATVGTLLNETFPGSGLNSTNWNGSLPTGASISSKLIIASGASDWSRFIELKNLYLYEKADWVFDFKAVTKASGDGWGLQQWADTSFMITGQGVSIFIKVDLSNGADSGRVSIGTGQNAAGISWIGSSAALAFSAGDSLKLTIKRTPWKTITILENTTTPSAAKAYGEFDIKQWGTQGNIRLTFLGGQQEFTRLNISSRMRNFGGLSGAVYLEDSIGVGYGATSVDRRWVNIAMKGQQHLFEEIGVASWRSVEWAYNSCARVTEALSVINAKYLVIAIGFNDHAQGVSTSTYETNLTAIANAAIALGYTVIFVSPYPNGVTSSAAYATSMQTVATSLGCKYVDARTISTSGGLAISDDSDDGVHPNDKGHYKRGIEVLKQAPELSQDWLADYDNSYHELHNLPLGYDTDDVLSVDVYGRIRRMPKAYIHNKNLRLQTTIYEYQTGNVALSGEIRSGGAYQQTNTTQGFQAGFALNPASNIHFTNETAGGLGQGTPQAFGTVSGEANVLIHALRTTNKGSYLTNVTGNYNVAIGPYAMLGSAVSGSGNLDLNLSNSPSTISSGSNNIRISPNAGQTTSSNSILIGWAASGWGNAANRIHLGFGQYAGAPADTVIFDPKTEGSVTVYPGGYSAYAKTVTISGPLNTGGGAGHTVNIQAGPGNASNDSGILNLRSSVPGAHGTWINTISIKNNIATMAGNLTLVAGTTSVAPVTFVSGTNKTTAGAGDVEYNGTNFFMTATANNRRQVVRSNVATPTLGVSPIGNGSDFTLTNVFSQISVTASINAGTTGVTSLFTVPASGNSGLIISHVLVEVTSVTGTASVPPAFNIGTNPSYNNIVAFTTTGLVNANTYQFLFTYNGAAIATPGDAINFETNVPCDVPMTVRVRLFGYYLQ